MQIEVAELESCKLKVSYVADAAEIFTKRGEVMDQFKKAPVPGFRQGKASVDAIRMHYRTQIEDALKRALAEDAYHHTLFEKKIKPHGAPRFNNLLLADGKFTCEFELYTKPEFTLASYSNLEVVKPHESKSAINLCEEMMQELRIRFGEVAPYVEGDFIQTGDNVIIDYDAFLDNVKVENISGVGEMITVGQSQLKNFDDNLLGMTLGEVREFDLVVPEDGLPSMAGKSLHFKVTLNMGSKTTPCPLDDTLAEKLGKKDYNELKEFMHATAGARIANSFKMAVTEQVAQKMLAANTISVPNWMTLSEAQYLVHSAKLNWNELPDVDKEKYMTIAEKNVKLALILDKIREVEPDAQLTDQEAFEIIKNNLAKTKLQASLDDIIKEMSRTGYLQILFSRIKDEHTLDFIVKSVKIIE